MSTPTSARPKTSRGEHFYDPNTGKPCHFVPRANGEGARPANVADARANGWVPGVTTVLAALDKPALHAWKVEQALLACLTAPRREGEGIDAFVQRVIHEERQHEVEAAKSAHEGTALHDALASALRGQVYEERLRPWVEPIRDYLSTQGEVVGVEEVYITRDYGCRIDAVLVNTSGYLIYDFKTTSKLPEESWMEHRLQLAAYGKAFERCKGNKICPLAVRNLYLLRSEPNKFKVTEHPTWQRTYFDGFVPLLAVWNYLHK